MLGLLRELALEHPDGVPEGWGVPAVLPGVPAGVGGSELEWEAFRLPVGGHQAGRPGGQWGGDPARALEIKRLDMPRLPVPDPEIARETLKVLQRAGHLRRSPDS